MKEYIITASGCFHLLGMGFLLLLLLRKTFEEEPTSAI